MPSPTSAGTRVRRTQADRSAATRDALVAAGRRLFAAEGFAAVLEAVEADIARRLAEAAAAKAASDPVEAARQAMRTWLEICVEPEIYRIALIDGPSVVGWAHWREVCQRHVFGLTESLLERGIQLGHIREQPVRPLAHVVMGASDEAALYVAESADPARARTEMLAALDRLIDGISAL